jgi:hypothetical protein
MQWQLGCSDSALAQQAWYIKKKNVLWGSVITKASSVAASAPDSGICAVMRATSGFTISSTAAAGRAMLADRNILLASCATVGSARSAAATGRSKKIAHVYETADVKNEQRSRPSIVPN